MEYIAGEEKQGLRRTSDPSRQAEITMSYLRIPLFDALALRVRATPSIRSSHQNAQCPDLPGPTALGRTMSKTTLLEEREISVTPTRR